MRTRINSNVTIPQQEINMPMTLVVGENDNTTTTRIENNGSRSRGWLFGAVWTIIGLVGLAVLIALLWGALKSQPESVDYSGALQRIEQKVDTAAQASTDAATYAKNSRDILIPTAQRVNANGRILDHSLSVVYDASGNVKGSAKLDDVLIAAQAAQASSDRAATAAEKPRYVVKRVEVPTPSAVDMSETNSRLSAIERALADQAKPTLERVNDGQ